VAAARVLVTLVLTALAVWFTRRAGRAGQGATALVLGITGTAVGGAHLAKAGLNAALHPAITMSGQRAGNSG
jgi:hypothetical protein